MKITSYKFISAKDDMLYNVEEKFIKSKDIYDVDVVDQKLPDEPTIEGIDSEGFEFFRQAWKLKLIVNTNEGKKYHYFIEVSVIGRGILALATEPNISRRDLNIIKYCVKRRLSPAQMTGNTVVFRHDDETIK